MITTYWMFPLPLYALVANGLPCLKDSINLVNRDEVFEYNESVNPPLLKKSVDIVRCSHTHPDLQLDVPLYINQNLGNHPF